jgi:hypothetical protein
MPRRVHRSSWGIPLRNQGDGKWDTEKMFENSCIISLGMLSRAYVRCVIYQIDLMCLMYLMYPAASDVGW